jgi:hypothetical protein
MVAGSAVQKFGEIRRTPTIIDGCFRYVSEIYIWLKVLSLEQSWEKELQKQIEWQNYTCIKRRYRYSKEKKVGILLLKVMNNE